MAKDFFGSLGETLTKTAKELSGRAEEVYETQRLKNKISGEERQIEKGMPTSEESFTNVIKRKFR